MIRLWMSFDLKTSFIRSIESSGDDSGDGVRDNNDGDNDSDGNDFGNAKQHDGHGKPGDKDRNCNDNADAGSLLSQIRVLVA